MTQEQAFLQAFDKHADVLFRHCFFRVSDRERAVEIVQEAFTRTWDYLAKGNTIEDFKPFLFRTVNHLIIDEYRKKKPDSLDALLNEGEVPEGRFEELRTEGRDEIELVLDAGNVRALLERMPPQYRDVIVMRYFDGLMPQEIGNMLNESVNVVSVRIHRGLVWLRNNIDTPEPQQESVPRVKARTRKKKKK